MLSTLTFEYVEYELIDYTTRGRPWTVDRIVSMFQGDIQWFLNQGCVITKVLSGYSSI